MSSTNNVEKGKKGKGSDKEKEKEEKVGPSASATNGGKVTNQK